MEQFWRLPALPGAHSCKLLTSLSEMGSQGIRRESNPYLLVHSQACSDRYTTDTCQSAARPGFEGRNSTLERWHDFRFTIEPTRSTSVCATRLEKPRA